MPATRGIPRLLIAVAVLGAAFGGPATAHAGASDWVLQRAQFAAGGGSVALEGTVVPNGEGPLIFGSGFGDGRASVLFVDDLGGGGISLRTTDDLGGLSVQVTSPTVGTFHFIIEQGVFSRAPVNLDLLAFVANASFTGLDSHAHGGTVTSSSGSGSQAIYVAGPGTSGVAADASVVAAGASTTARQLASGIVGGTTFECTACTIGWASPDGATGTFTETNVPFPPVPVPVPIPIPIPGGVGSGDPVFAGPAGSWKWSWTGATINLDPSTAVVGAYAPIGDAWRMFRPGSGSLGGGGSAGFSGGSGGGGSNRSHPATRVAAKHEARTLANTGVASDGVAWMLLLVGCLAARRLRAITW